MSIELTEMVLGGVIGFVKSDCRDWDFEDGDAWQVVDVMVQALSKGLDEVEVWGPDCCCDNYLITFSNAEVYRICFNELPEGLKGQVNQLLQAMIAEGIPETDEELRLWSDRWYWEWSDED